MAGERGRRRRADPRSFVSAWTEKDLLDGKVVDSFVVIFRTTGCYWARSDGCSMCGYVFDTSLDVTEDDLMHQLGTAAERHQGQAITKVFTSGSFFDEHEVPPDFRRAVLKEFGGRSKKVLVETLAPFTKKELVEEAASVCDEFEVAFGLESATPAVLKHSVNKPFGLEQHLKAASIVHDCGGSVKTYLLIKPPFLTEREAIEDAVSSAEKVADCSDTVSFNPVNVQRGTLVERMWRRGQFRPPWLWSVVEVLERTKSLKARVMSDPTAAGHSRGAHNCGKCDAKVTAAIKDFSLGLRENFDGVTCDCRDRWLDSLELEGPLQAALNMDALLERDE